MQVILKTNIKNLGQAGMVVTVKDGYARNFLIPKGLAVEANTKNIKALEHEKKKIEDLIRKEKLTAEILFAKLNDLTITITARAGEEEKLFGSITSMDIAEELKKQGFDIDKRRILLEDPIKRLGEYPINIKLHQNNIAKINVKVVAQ
ncbi:MAG: 50S ribosomal protein L9 [Thermodesulfovibrionales bacterium]|nr:50S ribosomal protein L9 [Thermodesulfovibrionales bacterium]